MKRQRILPIVHWILGAALVASGAGLASAEADLPPGVFAQVNDEAISGAEFQAAVAVRARQKFYHGHAPEPELRQHRIAVGDFLIERVLLAKEADRRGIQADESKVAAQLARLEQRAAATPDWASRKRQFREDVGRSLRTASRIAALEAQVRRLPPPTEAELRDYYTRHPDKFTTPERTKVSVILRRVPASGSPEQWEAARDETEQLAAQVRGGANFSDLARRHSQDPSAEQGGDLGYLHEHMLGSSAQEALAALQPGELSGPVRLLEGYALLRLDARDPGKVNPFDSARPRVTALWQREAQEAAWQSLQRGLRASARIRVAERYYDGAAEAAGAGHSSGGDGTAAANRGH